jgi:protein phosphatase
MPFEISLATDVGRIRSGNEDSAEVVELADGALCVVADGMGGHQAGEVASHVAVEAIRQAFAGGSARGPDALVAAIEAANRAVYDEAGADAAKQGMGTTVVCALLTASRADLANVGDSPAYLVRGKGARQLTHDHSWVAEEVARGELSEQEAAVHPYRHVLTRCLGLTPGVEVETYAPLELEPGDVLVLCSDGLSEHVHPDELPGVVGSRSPGEAARALIDLANQRGGSDNITVVVARWQP